MRLIPLAAQICKAFTEADSDKLRTVQKVKHDQARDVVTELDMKLHDISSAFSSSNLVGSKFLSEEGSNDSFSIGDLLQGRWLVVDPLDGSNNYALQLPGYGYMAAVIDEGLVTGTCVVLPEHDQYIVMEGASILVSKPIVPSAVSTNSPIYYAYPPKQTPTALIARNELQLLFDWISSGMYRYGSACIGLYNLLLGKHQAFIGHQIRIWDALAFLPILRASNIDVYYCLEGLGITLIASRNSVILKRSISIIEAQGLTLCNYEISDRLKVNDL